MYKIKLLGFIFFTSFVFSVCKLNAALCVTTGSGDWSNAATWSCGFVPSCGDSIVVLATHTVELTSQVNLSACPNPFYLNLLGTLSFKAGSKLRLPCGSIIWIFPGASIIDGGGGGNSNTIEICDDVYWKASEPSLVGFTCLPPTNPLCSTALPVELIAFTGIAKDGYVDIHWSTITESNSCCFNVERSLDLVSFEKVANHDSKSFNGNSNSRLDYNTTDDNPVSNVSYYRLKQIDRDNTFSYSTIVSVNYIKVKNVKFVVYPNPNKGEFTADISGIENNHEVQISLKDEKGSLVYNSTFYLNDAGSSKLQIIPANHLSNGLYICTLTLEGIEYNVKVVVN